MLSALLARIKRIIIAQLQNQLPALACRTLATRKVRYVSRLALRSAPKAVGRPYAIYAANAVCFFCGVGVFQVLCKSFLLHSFNTNPIRAKLLRRKEFALIQTSANVTLLCYPPWRPTHAFSGFEPITCAQSLRRKEIALIWSSAGVAPLLPSCHAARGRFPFRLHAALQSPCPRVVASLGGVVFSTYCLLFPALTHSVRTFYEVKKSHSFGIAWLKWLLMGGSWVCMHAIPAGTVCLNPSLPS